MSYHFKTILVCVLLVSLGASADVQKAECYGPEGAPVNVIYLHGLFPIAAASDPNGFRSLEANNRLYLQKLITYYKTKKLRIAVPVSDALSGTMRYWNTKSLSQIESMASAACQAPLAQKRVMIGFSNGAYRVDRISNLACTDLGNYVSLESIGTPMPNTGSNNCGMYSRVIKHQFPPDDQNFIFDGINKL